jgi:hypothetical protein
MKKIRNTNHQKKQPPPNLPDTLKCHKCAYTITAPNHCRGPMHIEDGLLVCWMGKKCGSQKIPVHCKSPMIFVPIIEELP